MGRWFAVFALLLVACGRDEGMADDEYYGGDDEPDDDCHWDCFGSSTCTDGIVTTVEHAPVPCEYWEGECPSWRSYECERGCRTDITSVGPSDPPELMCEELRPKQVGDLCDDPSDCLPEVATWDGEDNVTNVYLECDVTLGQCIAREPPVVSDWLGPCGLVPDAYPDSYAYGFAETDACTGGVCLYIERDACVEQGCTIRCAGDGECPPGSVCEPDWRVCKPGPPNVIGIDLTCPP